MTLTLPAKEMADLEAYCKSRGLTKTSAIRNMMQQYLITVKTLQVGGDK
jgi:hypothetical protein